MKPASLHLGNFATRVAKARLTFENGRGYPSEWLVFYDEKQSAYDVLCEKVPQIKEIPDFWRWVQNSASLDWITWTEREILRIVKSAQCSCGIKLKWPQKTCEKCSKLRQEKAKLAKKSRKAVNRRVKALSRAKKARRNRSNQKTVSP